MTICFDIKDVTTLTGKRSLNVTVTQLLCVSAEMGLANRLSDAIVREANDFVAAEQAGKAVK